jgi:hypothetical protein
MGSHLLFDLLLRARLSTSMILLRVWFFCSSLIAA